MPFSKKYGTKNQPVMGIGMFSSPVMQLNVRDDWIGWTINSLLRRIKNDEINIDELIKFL